MKRAGHMLFCRFRRPIKTFIEFPDGNNWPPEYIKTFSFDLNDRYYVQVTHGHLYLGILN